MSQDSLRRRRENRVIPLKDRFRFNITYFLFLILFIYIVFVFLSYLGKKHVSIYEVNYQSIADDNICRGLIIRDETVYKSSDEGYINYYVSDGDCVGKNQMVYTLDAKGSVYNELTNSENEITFTSDNYADIRSEIFSFKNTYQDSSFSSVADFQYTMENKVMELSDNNRAQQLRKMMKQSSMVKDALSVVKTQDSGIISYTVDGLEGITVSQVGPDQFKKEAAKTQLRQNGSIDAQTSVYKLITSDAWSLVLNLDKEQYQKLKEKQQTQKENGYTTGQVSIRFIKDDISTVCDFDLFTKQGGYFATLSLNKYLIHFINDRYIDVELCLNSASGLKIPNTAITEETFFTIPVDYLSFGATGSSEVITVLSKKKNGENSYSDISPEIYYKDEKTAYILSDQLETGDMIVNPTTKDTLMLGDTGKLTGVYNINKGYSIFQRIEPVYENEEYTIVKCDTDYGLSNYDHILLDASAASNLETIQ
ncbi:MAG: HlyD family efflux transporter periplasmic adaptor subunit [Clostridiales bacterium]|nr:HlyD family efflux transporter periplasmic adaptor subunit [Clostridiales bacterium]